MRKSRRIGIWAQAWFVHVVILILVSFLVIRYEGSPQSRDRLFGLENFITGCNSIDNALMYFAYATALLLILYSIFF